MQQTFMRIPRRTSVRMAIIAYAASARGHEGGVRGPVLAGKIEDRILQLFCSVRCSKRDRLQGAALPFSGRDELGSACGPFDLEATAT